MKKIVLILILIVGMANASEALNTKYVDGDESGIPIIYTHTADHLYVSYDGFDIRCKQNKGKIKCQELNYFSKTPKWEKSNMSDYSDDLMEVIKNNITYVGK